MFKFNINTQSTHPTALALKAALETLLPAEVSVYHNEGLLASPYHATITLTSFKQKQTVTLQFSNQTDELSRYAFSGIELSQSVSSWVKQLKQLQIDDTIATFYQTTIDWIYVVTPKRKCSIAVH